MKLIYFFDTNLVYYCTLTVVDMYFPANDGTLINIDTNTTNFANCPHLVECSPNDNKKLMSDDLDDSSITIRITPHFESKKAKKELSISPIYLSETYKPAPWEVSVAFFPNYLSRINLDLKGLLYVDMEKIEESAESSVRESAVQAPPPFYIVH